MRAFKTVVAAGIVAALAGLASPPAAAAGEGRPPIDQAVVDRAVVDRALAYLNDARTMTADFVQRDQAGGYWTGRMWIARPGRLRFQYDPPENDVIWSSGGLIKHFDAELETLSQAPPSMTPAWFLLDDKVRITEDVQLLATAERDGRFFVTAAQTDRVADGRVTLAFEENPARLLGWTTVSAGGAYSQVDLIDLKTGVDIPEDVFQYDAPVRRFNEN